MSTVAKKTSTTPQEYLALEHLAEFKSEYHDGQIDGWQESHFATTSSS